MFCAVLSFPAQNCFAQQRLSFIIKSAKSGETLGKSSLRAFGKNGKMLSFAIADNSGRAVISANPTDTIEFSSLGHSSLRKAASSFSSSEDNTVKLEESAFELREITVKAPPIRVKKDTLVYDAKAFMAKGDTHLEDLLKKLPGIKVADNGAVSYQGKPINRFYIEGNDLLGSSYNQATRNMPVDAISAVEVLENHQPAKILEERQFSDKAALNIRLDKSHRSRPFGEASIGAGASPFIWNNSIFLTQILEKHQFLITTKMNNSGEDISNDTREHIDVGDLEAYEPELKSVAGSYLSSETLPYNRYMKNNSYSAGINYLTTVGKDGSLRANIVFYQDDASTNKYSENFYAGINDVTITDNRYRKENTLTVIPTLKYELNSKKVFLSDEMRYSFNRTSGRSDIRTSTLDISEKSVSRPSFFQNYLRADFNAGNMLWEVKSFFRFFRRNESLESASDSIAFYNMAESLSSQSVTVKNVFSTSLPLFGNNFRIAGNVNYRNYLYDFNGSSRYEKFQLRLRPAYTLRWTRGGYISVEIPLEWMRLSLSSLHTDNRMRDVILILPAFSIGQNIGNHLKLTISGSISADNLLDTFYSPFLIRTGYRTQLKPDNNLFLTRNCRASARLSYRNLLYLFFANASVTYTRGKDEAYSNFEYTDSMTYITKVGADNTRDRLMANISADKSFPEAGVSVKANINYSMNSYLVSQSGILTRNKSNIIGLDLNVDFNYLKWMRLSAGVTGNIFWERNKVYDNSSRRSLKTKAAFFLFPISRIEFKASYDNYLNEISDSRFKNFGMLDISLKYKIGKKWETALSVTNLLDVREYSVTTDNALSIFHTSLPLRGREFLASLRFRF